jgi:hypothetical protein
MEIYTQYYNWKWIDRLIDVFAYTHIIVKCKKTMKSINRTMSRYDYTNAVVSPYPWGINSRPPGNGCNHPDSIYSVFFSMHTLMIMFMFDTISD